MPDVKTPDKPVGKQVSPFDLVDTHPENKVVRDPQQAEMQRQLDTALKDSFPASDAISISQPITAGPSAEASEAMAVNGPDTMAADETLAETKAKVPRKDGEPDAE